MALLKLDNIPDELIVRIFEELDVKDLLNCSLTCRLFYVTIQDSLILQYHIELAVAGVEDGGPASPLTTAERLAQLKTIEDGWANMRFRHKLRVEPYLSNLWELFGGVIAHGVDAVSPIGMTRGLSFTELPSAVRGTLGRSWQHRDMGVNIRDFGIDPAQDLAVLIAHPVAVANPPFAPKPKYLIHLRAMSTGGSHPRSSKAVLSCISNPINARCSFVIQVMGDFLAVLFHSSTQADIARDRLYIWNWKTCRLVTNLGLSPSNRARIDSFSFLSPRHFVVPRFKHNAHADNPPVLEVYDFLTASPERRTDPRLVRTFQLPRTTPNTVILSMLTRSDPSPESSLRLPAVHGRPFYTAPTSRLLTIRIESFNTLGAYMLFVHHSTLLEDLVPEENLKGPSPIIPWEDWGPKKSRLIPVSFGEASWVCYTHGTRYVRLEPVQESEPPELGEYYLRMLDFNQRALHRDASSSLSDGESAPQYSTVVLASEPTVIPTRESIFVDEIVTTLPYRDVFSSEEIRYDAVMIDEDCIVGCLPRGGVLREFELLCI